MSLVRIARAATVQFSVRGHCSAAQQSGGPERSAPCPSPPTCHTILHAGNRSAGSRELGGCPSLRAARPCRRAVGPSPLTRRTLSTAPAAARTITLAHAASQPQRVGACCVIGTRINELSTETSKPCRTASGVRTPPISRARQLVTSPAPGRDYFSSPPLMVFQLLYLYPYHDAGGLPGPPAS